MDKGTMAMPGLAADQHSCWMVGNVFGAIYPVFMAAGFSFFIQLPFNQVFSFTSQLGFFFFNSFSFQLVFYFFALSAFNLLFFRGHIENRLKLC